MNVTMMLATLLVGDPAVELEKARAAVAVAAAKAKLQTPPHSEHTLTEPARIMLPASAAPGVKVGDIITVNGVPCRVLSVIGGSSPPLPLTTPTAAPPRPMRYRPSVGRC